MNRILIEPRPLKAPSKPASPRSASKVQTRERILTAARTLFTERGYEAATVRDIASGAGLSTGAVFANFADKADLFNAVMAQDYERLIEVAGEAMDEAEAVEDALLALARAGYVFHLQQLPLLQAANSLSWSPGLAGQHGNRPAYRVFISSIVTLLQRGAEGGELPAAANVELIAEMVWDHYIANYRRAIFDGWDLDALMTRLGQQVRMILAGVRAQASGAPA